MYYVLKKHSRRLMAFFGVILMVAFLIPTVARNPNRGDVTIGTVNGKKIMYADKIAADHDWQMLRSRIMVPSRNSPYGVEPLAARLGPTGAAINELERHQDLFMLLLADARTQGVFVTDDRVDQLYDLVQVMDLDPTNQDQVESVKHALRSFLMVRDAFDRALSAVRVSAPIRDYELATRYQSVKVNAVEFSGDDYMSKVPAASKEQLEAFFNKYKDVDPATVDPLSTTNPFGFGYRFADRATLQYIMVPTDEVRKAVRQSQSDKYWRREAAKYYLQHQDQFQAPSTQPGMDTTGLSAPKSTTQPFEQAASQAEDTVIMDQVRKLQTQIISRLNSTLVNDYNSFRQAKPGEKVTSSLGVPYNSYEYMQKLAQDIQKNFKVMPTIEQIGDLTSARELVNKPRIGEMATASRLPLALYATMTEDSRRMLLRNMPGAPAILQPWQPSQIVRDVLDDVAIFRVMHVDPAHSPKSMDEVAQKVAQDYQKEQAFELAKKAATEFAQAAKSEGFATTTQAQKKKLLTTGFYSRSSRAQIDLKLDDQGNNVFATLSMKELLQGKANGENRPVAVVPVARDNKLFVTQLEQIRQNATPAQLAYAAEDASYGVIAAYATRLESDWFNYKNVVERTAYKPVENQKRDDSSAPAAPEAPAPPAGPLDL